MDEKEYTDKYVNLRILKSIQEYLKADNDTSESVYPVRVPEDFVYLVLKMQGPDNVDKLIHHIFRLGLDTWSDRLYNEAFGSQRDLEEFIELVKKRNKK